MENYRYGSYHRPPYAPPGHYPPPLEQAYSGYPQPNWPPYGPSSAFSTYPSEPQPPPPPRQPELYPQYSGYMQYPPPPQPSYRPPDLSPSPSYGSIQYPSVAPPLTDYPYAPPAPRPSFQQQSSFVPGELRLPPPHSDSFIEAYGSNHGSPRISRPPIALLEDMVANVHITGQPPPPRPPSQSPSVVSLPSQPSFGSSVSSRLSCEGQPLGHSGPLLPFKSGNSSWKVLLLHGNLDVWVYYARNLPNMDMFSNTIANMMGSRKDTSDPYVTFSAESGVLGRTFVRDNDENPVWDQHFYVHIAHRTSKITFTVKDDDFVGSQIIGTVDIHAEKIYGGVKLEDEFPILSDGKKPCKPGAVLKLSIQYVPIENLAMYHQGIEAGPNYCGVAGTYFPLRKGGQVKLYQDAHVPHGYLPDIPMWNGMHYEHGRCWDDIFTAISEAKHLVYITGWSVYHEVRLVRDGPRGSDITLGELLRQKTKDNVRVLLLIWDDPTSRSFLGIKKNGIMDTHDEDTRRFFKNSSVHVLLCPREAGKRHSWAKKQEAGFIYTHHQKSVIVDADAGNDRRKIIAFVGGLDLCKGRYDSPNHFLFRNLSTLHNDDFHNPNFTGVNDGGPREPWHDLHCRIDGPAAYDVLCNFEERWLKASKRHRLKKLGHFYDDDRLLKLEGKKEIMGIEEAIILGSKNPDMWHVQIFRSIDSNSVKGFPKDSREVSRKNLAYGKNVLIDMSIHTAYVKAIRSAQHFIYIENQYFLGSSYNWHRHKNLGANNLIPMEIALKIANKIRSGERFSVYIVIPMWPEGNPMGNATQQILYWQYNTMQMMYATIYDALKEAGLENQYSPEDYLNFFCLGNRENYDGKQLASSTANTPLALSQKNRRFMIYVHSKGMIVDDEYVMMGSANINQRSLEGTRDSEIAMGAYEPRHTWSRIPSGPLGQVHAYRMSLWSEHIGWVEECFKHPESLECTKRIREIAMLNWDQFASPIVTEMSGHLLKYPLFVDREGKVTSLPGCETFPDVGGKICGSFFGIEENLTI